MREWYRDRRARRQASKAKAGDGSPLKPYRWWQVVHRSLFSIKLADERGEAAVYSVDLDHCDERSRTFLYTDGVQTARSTLPAAFPVTGGRIEVASTLYGLKRIHLVRDDGSEQVLTPHRHSAEGLRGALDRRLPVLSTAIGLTAIAVLLASLVVALPALLEVITQWDEIAGRFGTFTSPINLPDWVNTTLLVATIVAALERALMLRNHWLIDLDSHWFDS